MSCCASRGGPSAHCAVLGLQGDIRVCKAFTWHSHRMKEAAAPDVRLDSPVRRHVRRRAWAHPQVPLGRALSAHHGEEGLSCFTLGLHQTGLLEDGITARHHGGMLCAFHQLVRQPRRAGVPEGSTGGTGAVTPGLVWGGDVVLAGARVLCMPCSRRFSAIILSEGSCCELVILPAMSIALNACKGALHVDILHACEARRRGPREEIGGCVVCWACSSAPLSAIRDGTVQAEKGGLDCLSVSLDARAGRMALCVVVF